jgi:biopolymer transport protein ExbB
MIAIWNFILTGGIVMFPLLICSIIALVLIIEKIITLKKTKIIRPDIIDILSHITNMEDVHLALSFCQKKKGPFANLVFTSLNSLNLETQEIKELITDEGRQEIRSLERGLPALETIAAITPILGLLGTVIGMIRVFKVIAIQGVGDPAILSGGISEALVSTAAGLAVALPTLVFYNYLSNKAENLVLDIEKHINELLRKIRNLK